MSVVLKLECMSAQRKMLTVDDKYRYSAVISCESDNGQSGHIVTVVLNIENMILLRDQLTKMIGD